MHLVALVSILAALLVSVDGFVPKTTVQSPTPKTTGLSSPTHVKKPPNKVTEFDLLIDKALDTCEDIGLHMRRMLPYNRSVARIRPRVVVLGSGWGAHALLKVVDTELFDVLCVSPRPFFVFTPMLASTAVGTVEYRSIVENIRTVNPRMEYIEAEAVDVSDKDITVSSTLIPNAAPFKVPFDYLIYAVGSQVADFGVSGVKEHCCFIKEVDDVRKIKKDIFGAFEQASLPITKDSAIDQLLTFVVVGGGPTGVEFSAELGDFVREEVVRLYPRLVGRAKIVLLNSANNVLNVFDQELQLRALRSLRGEGVDLRLGVRVKKVNERSVVYQSKEDNKETILPFGICVWAAGNAVRPITSRFAASLGAGQVSTVAKYSRLAVDDWLRLKTSSGFSPNVFALGDVSVTVDSNALPQTAQVAAQQGAYLARQFNRGYNFSSPQPSLEKTLWTKDTLKALRVRGALLAKPFAFLNLGILAYVGEGEAVAQVQLGNLNMFDAAGQNAFLLWRSVYIVKQVSVRTRMLVIFDFLKTKLFGRDFTTL